MAPFRSPLWQLSPFVFLCVYWVKMPATTLIFHPLQAPTKMWIGYIKKIYAFLVGAGALEALPTAPLDRHMLRYKRQTSQAPSHGAHHHFVKSSYPWTLTHYIFHLTHTICAPPPHRRRAASSYWPTAHTALLALLPPPEEEELAPLPLLQPSCMWPWWTCSRRAGQREGCRSCRSLSWSRRGHGRRSGPRRCRPPPHIVECMWSLTHSDAVPLPPYSRTAKYKHTVSSSIQPYIINIIRKVTLWTVWLDNQHYLVCVITSDQFVVVELICVVLILWAIVKK